MSDYSLHAVYRSGEIELSRQILTDFAIEQADRTVREVGFIWKPTAEAPSRFVDLERAFMRSQATGDPLPISSENNESLIYTTPAANTAFRFWHDVNHVQRRATFDLVDELELALWHLSVLEAEGFTPASVPWKMLHADLIGQAQLMALTRRFPLDQQRFVSSCLVDGFEQGLIDEARRDNGNVEG